MTTEPLLLAIDDEASILKLVKLELTAQGFHVLTATNGAEGLDLAEKHRPDIVVLDIAMPEMSGLEVMNRLREHSSTPIILLTARDTERDRVGGLELGADDYVVKPFSLDELAARIRAVLRRSVNPTAVQQVVQVGEVAIDLDRRQASKSGQPVALTRNEWLLLQTFAAHPGKVLLNAELLTKVWGPEYRDDVQYLRVWISRLRHKLEDDPAEPALIRTVPGIGYMLANETAPAAAAVC